jgi:putative peptidoglycan lipid II flippase
MLNGSLRGALFLTIPSAVAILLLREDLIRALFQWNDRMSGDSVAMTAGVLAFYCIAIVSHTFVFLLNMTFYSMGKTRIPLLAGLISLGSNLLLCFVFSSATTLGVSGMALAYSASSILSAVFLFLWLKRRHPKNAPRSLTPFLVKAGVSALLSAGSLLLIDLAKVSPAGKIGQFLWIGARLLVAAGVYLGVAAALGMPEFHSSLDRIRRRLAGKSPQNRGD